MKKINKKLLLVATFIVFFVLIQFYPLVESTQASCTTSLGIVTCIDDVVVTLQVDSGLSLSDGANVTMAPHISVGVNSSIGSSAWTVITNNVNGYSLSVNPSTAPALQLTIGASDTFANYTETSPGDPEQPWSVASGAKEFGYSAYGADTLDGTWGTAHSCGAAGAPSTTQSYVGFKTDLSKREIANKSSATTVAGVTTTICFAAQQNGTLAVPGTYTATITGTAITL